MTDTTHDEVIENNAPTNESSAPSIRDALSSAFDEATDETPADGVVPDSGTNVPNEGTPSRERNPDGTFAPKKADLAPPPPPKAGEGVTPPADAAKAAKDAADAAQAEANRRAVKAPQSWTPAAREKWNSIDPVAQQQIIERDRQVNRVLQETAGARQFTENMTKTISPFLGMIQANGGDVFGYVGNLLQASAALQQGAPQYKAEIVANIVKQFGVNIEMLDAALAGVAPQGQPDPNAQVLQTVQQLLDQRLAPVQQVMSRIGESYQQGLQRLQSETHDELAEFEATNPEFLADVKPIMADLIELAARRGQDLSFKDAYEQATGLHPEVKRVILGRQQANTAAELTRKARAAREASSSISGSPATGVPQVDQNAPAGHQTSLRASIESAWASLAGN